MHIKKLFRGFNISTVNGAVIAPFIMILCKDIDGAVFAGIWCGCAFMFVSIASYLLSRWYSGSEFAALTLSVSCFFTYLIYTFSGKTEYEMPLIVTALSFLYLIKLGTDSFTRRPELSWCLGVCFGIFSAALVIGIISSIMPSEPGFRFIAAAFYIVICRKISVRVKI